MSLPLGRQRLGAAFIVTISGLLSQPATAHAQTPRIEPVPFQVPESPAFRFLGINPSSVDRPTTPQKLALSLANARDSSGKVKNGIAIGIAPAQFLYRWTAATPTLKEYQHKSWNNWKYYLWNSSISAGTTATPNDTTSSDLGAGFRIVVWDESDVMRDSLVTTAIAASVQNRCRSTDGSPGDPQKNALCADAEYQRALKAWSDTGGGVWNHGGFGMAGAVGWRAVDSHSDHLVPLGWTVWTSLSQRLSRWGVVSFQLQHDNRRPLGENASRPERIYTFGSRLIAGKAKANAFVDYAGSYFVSSDSLNKAWKKRWSGGVEFRVLDRLWLETGFGNQVKTVKEPDHVFYFAGLKLQLFQNAVIRQ